MKSAELCGSAFFLPFDTGMTVMIPHSFTAAFEFLFFEHVEIFGVEGIHCVILLMDRIAVIKKLTAAVVFVFVITVFPVEIFFVHIIPSLFCGLFSFYLIQ